MADKQIKITSDVSKLLNDLKKVKQEINEINKAKQDITFSTSRTTKQLDKLHLQGYQEALEKEKQRLRDALIKERQNRKASNVLSDPNWRPNGLGGASISPVSGIGSPGGLGIGGSAGIARIAMGVGAAMGGAALLREISSLASGIAKTLIQPAFNNAGANLSLAGLGFNPAARAAGVKLGAGFGFGTTESLNQMYSMSRAVGGYSSQAFAGMQLFSRATGALPEEVIGGMSNLRKAGISGDSSIKMMKEFYVDAIASGFDESRSMDFLKAMSDNIGAMAMKGAVNPAVYGQIATGLMKSNPFFAQNEGRSLVAIQSLESKFKQNGAGSALAYRTLMGMNQFSGMSPIQLIEQQRMGFTNSAYGQGIFQNYLGQIGQQSIGKRVGYGQSLSEEDRARFSVGLSNFTGMEQSMAKEVVSAFMKGDIAGAKGLFDEANKNFEQKTYDVIADPSFGLKVLTASMGSLIDLISEKVAAPLSKLSDVAEKMLGNVEKVADVNFAFFSGIAKFIDAAKLLIPGGSTLPSASDNLNRAYGNTAYNAISGVNRSARQGENPGNSLAQGLAGLGMSPGSSFSQILGGTTTSPFGVDRGTHAHGGVDKRMPTGTGVKATMGGKVVSAGPMGAYGNAILVDHGGGIRTLYGHLSQVDVKEGDYISAGQIAGLSGNTGRSSGPHLHHEVRKNGGTVDPISFYEEFGKTSGFGSGAVAAGGSANSLEIPEVLKGSVNVFKHVLKQFRDEAQTSAVHSSMVTDLSGYRKQKQ